MTGAAIGVLLVAVWSFLSTEERTMHQGLIEQLRAMPKEERAGLLSAQVDIIADGMIGEMLDVSVSPELAAIAGDRSVKHAARSFVSALCLATLQVVNGEVPTGTLDEEQEAHRAWSGHVIDCRTCLPSGGWSELEVCDQGRTLRTRWIQLDDAKRKAGR